jgi:6-phosphogluconolactonase
MTTDRRVVVSEDPEALAALVAQKFISKVRASIRKHGHAGVVLTGGSMGSAVLRAVNDSDDRDSVEWDKVDFWWGDERWVPRDHPDRNAVQSREALLSHIPIKEKRVHEFPASDDGIDLDDAVAVFSAELAAHAAKGSELPRFDVLLLGVGPDGHIASLFPERGGIRVTDATVVPVRRSPKPPEERLSLTLPVINSAERVWAVLSGADKASVIGLALAGASVEQVPVSGIKGRRRTAYFVDQAAAAEVPENLIYPEY